MSLIVNTIIKEKNRIEYMLERYRADLLELPKGYLSQKETNGRIYYYLKYREGKKVISKYIGKDMKKIAEDIEKRKHIEVMIKSLEEELKIAEKVLEGNV